MDAMVIHRYGDPDEIQHAQIADPTPAWGEVRIRVARCAINGFDLMVRAGTFRANKSFPHVLGADVVGYVDEIGPGCSADIPVGTRVVLYWDVACGRCESCQSGLYNTCLDHEYLGAHLQGGYADYVVVPEVNVLRLPEGLDSTAAAALPMAYSTAWHMVVARGNVRPGDQVLVQAAGSGVGIAAVQLARLAGATVIATAGSDAKLALAERYGAEHLINYSTESIAARVKAITGKRGVDVVFDTVGGESWSEIVTCVTRNGKIVTCGGTAGYDVAMNIAYVFQKQLTIIGSTSATRRELEEVIQAVQAGRLEAVVDRTFAVSEAAAAHRYVSARSQFGKVVLNVEDGW